MFVVYLGGFLDLDSMKRRFYRYGFGVYICFYLLYYIGLLWCRWYLFGVWRVKKDWCFGVDGLER